MPVLMVSLPSRTSAGTLGSFLSQYQTLMCWSVRSIAYQPPPTALNCGPKLFFWMALTPQLWLFVAFESQFVPVLVLEVKHKSAQCRR